MRRDLRALRMISIVMPSMNQAVFLAEAVRSVFAERIPDLELVVMDGGSTDGTQRLLADLALEYPQQIRWFSSPDAGPASAINRGVQVARGPLIGWLNSDDLYAPGAIGRALAAFAEQPDAVMVYGEGEHVDERGDPLSAYPTLPPEAPLSAWADGCPICQPTVFFRRDAFLALGGLDTSLRASFDYELWLRLMAAHPGRVGFVRDVQAKTRMHAATITSRFRERVALEGVQVVRRHVGPPPAHWLLTHFEELCETHPFDAQGRLTDRCWQVLERARPWLDDATVRQLSEWIDQDERMRLSDAEFFPAIDRDGWARETCELRLRQPMEAAAIVRITVHGDHAAPTGESLLLDIVTPDGAWRSVEIARAGPFSFDIPVSDVTAGARLVYRIVARNAYLPPSDGASDMRMLAFRLSGLELQGA